METWDAYTSVLFVATAGCDYKELSDDVRGLFRRVETFQVPLPCDEDRVKFFDAILAKALAEPERTGSFVLRSILVSVSPYRCNWPKF